MGISSGSLGLNLGFSFAPKHLLKYLEPLAAQDFACLPPQWT
jgi:hypothetical protein